VLDGQADPAYAKLAISTRLEQQCHPLRVGTQHNSETSWRLSHSAWREITSGEAVSLVS
jgi:hypothetical protein